MANRWKFFLLLLIPITLLLGYFFTKTISHNKNKQAAQRIVEQCLEKDQPSCLQAAIVSFVSQYPKSAGKIMDAFWELAQNGEFAGDPRIFSDIVHIVGRTLVQNNVPVKKALVWCGLSFKQGCIHGAVIEYLDREYPAEVNAGTVFEWCRQTVRFNTPVYLNCLHGAGQALMAHNQLPIEALLNLCESFLPTSAQSACTSGMFMEYSKGANHHSDQPHATVGSQDLPCERLEEKYKPVCYVSAGSYRQYNPGQEEFNKSYNFCFSAPPEYVDDCLLGLSEQVAMTVGASQEKLEEVCNSLQNEKNKSACLETVVK